MSHSQANNLMDALEVNKNEENMEAALIVISKYGSYYNAMMQASKIEFKKKEALLFALVGDEELNNEKDEITKRAKVLIKACEDMETILFNESNSRGIKFEDFIKDCEFNNIKEETKAILNQVKPYCDYKRLIINIRCYQTGLEALNAFKGAIKQSETETLAISGDVQKMLKGQKDEKNNI